MSAKLNVVTEEDTVASRPATTTRKAYRPPVLRRLGSVADLTLGSGTFLSDSFVQNVRKLRP